MKGVTRTLLGGPHPWVRLTTTGPSSPSVSPSLRSPISSLRSSQHRDSSKPPTLRPVCPSAIDVTSDSRASGPGACGRLWSFQSLCTAFSIRVSSEPQRDPHPRPEVLDPTQTLSVQGDEGCCGEKDEGPVVSGEVWSPSATDGRSSVRVSVVVVATVTGVSSTSRPSRPSGTASRSRHDLGPHLHLSPRTLGRRLPPPPSPPGPGRRPRRPERTKDALVW